MIYISWKGKKIILKTLVACGIYSALGGVWQVLEIIVYGKIIPRYEDTFVTLFITFIIYKLFMKGFEFRD